jgi:hypothetical protein
LKPPSALPNASSALALSALTAPIAFSSSALAQLYQLAAWNGDFLRVPAGKCESNQRGAMATCL